jgi:hypothetical protein
MPSIVIIASTTPTSSSSSSTSSSMTTSTRPASASNLVTATGSPMQSQTAPTTTSSTTAQPTHIAAANAPLSKSQVAGIIVASVGGAAIFVGLIVLLACLRRKRNSRRDSDMLPFQLDPSTPQTYGGFRGPIEKGGKGRWNDTPTPPRVPPRLENSDPHMFSRRSVYPVDIGLAVSPQTPNPVVTRESRFSRLLPPKPTLRLVTPGMPQAPVELPGGPVQLKSVPVRAPVQIPPQDRQSVATQFEEDEWNSDEETPNSGIGNVQQTIAVFPTPPRNTNPAAKQSPHTFLFPNSEDGDSRPGTRDNGGTKQEPYLPIAAEFTVKPLNVNRKGPGSFSRPRPQVQIPSISQPGSLAIPNNLRPITASSSLYSQPSGSSLPPTVLLPQSNFPETRSQAYARKNASYKQTGPYDRASEGSLTSFDSVSSPDKDAYTPGGARKSMANDLSPVVESPASGKSPVSYPKIPPRGRLSAQTIKMVPPPPQPDFASVFSSRAAAAGANKPWRGPELEAQRQRRDDLRLSRATRPSPQVLRPPEMPKGTGDPSAYYRREVAPSLKTSGLATLPSQQQRAQPAPQFPYPTGPLQKPTQAQPVYPARTTSVSRPQQPNLGSPFQPAIQKPPPVQINNQNLRTIRRSPSQISQNSQASSNSSLLAKRLGKDKAAQLQLRTGPKSESKGNGWRVLGKDEKEAAKDPGWRPQLLQQVRTAAEREGLGNFGSGGAYVSPSRVGPGGGLTGGGAGPSDAGIGGLGSGKSVRFEVTPGAGGGEMPATPGWVPRLTPTRRGDELFLSVG